MSKSKMSKKKDVDRMKRRHGKCRQAYCRKVNVDRQIVEKQNVDKKKCRQERNVEHYKKKMSYDKFYL